MRSGLNRAHGSRRKASGRHQERRCRSEGPAVALRPSGPDRPEGPAAGPGSWVCPRLLPEGGGTALTLFPELQAQVAFWAAAFAPRPGYRPSLGWALGFPPCLPGRSVVARGRVAGRTVGPFPGRALTARRRRQPGLADPL